ncbi:helix-turn-helix domain-containing protein [Leucobacter sp. CSA1]|uniref:Helix-turn-helix domain-containing protein n=1 Tax=Leucobacter chromiisoli TaxID=2796471 RepID=A0A934UVK7_9MICO|nr:PucR family transcriptional regulator [Leucobacter chromiisoli]MBK0419042.1 helix-turn-helix domain-containing protein [Leucobacter chromiisoli]
MGIQERSLNGSEPPTLPRAEHPRERSPLETARTGLIHELLRKRQAIADDIVHVVSHDIVDYGELRANTLSEDVREAAITTVTVLLDSLLRRETYEQELEAVRRSAARRVHQEVSLPSLLHSYRIWGRELWQTVLREAGDDSLMRDAALGLVSDILDFVDRISVLVAQVYLEEAAGAYRARDVLRSDVLESLLIGKSLSDRARIDIARLNLSEDSRIAVVLVRLSSIAPERIRTESLRVLQAIRETVAPLSNTLLGVRESDVICLARIGRDSSLEAVIEAVRTIAEHRPAWRVCMGRPHDGINGVPRSFHEAQEAAIVAAAQKREGRATLFSEVMLDRILVHSDYGEELMDEFVRPLLDYDKQHSSSLVRTLQAYIRNDLNLSRTAKSLTVSPNTVAYRIKRIGELTGQDPATSSGILTLTLALRLHDG